MVEENSRTFLRVDGQVFREENRRPSESHVAQLNTIPRWAIKSWTSITKQQTHIVHEGSHSMSGIHPFIVLEMDTKYSELEHPWKKRRTYVSILVRIDVPSDSVIRDEGWLSIL